MLVFAPMNKFTGYVLQSRLKPTEGIYSPVIQEYDIQRLTLTHNDITIELAVPENWVVNPENLPNEVEAQSHESAYIAGTDFRYLQARLDEPSAFLYGDLPSEDQIGQFMEGLKAVLPYTEGYDPTLMSEVYRFRWGEYPAALFLAYLQNETTSQYVQWIGLEIQEDAVLLLQFEAVLPPQESPRASTLEQFAAIRASLSIDGQNVDPAGARVALERVTDPYSLSGAVVASLKLPQGTEMRMAAPENWYRRNMTENPEFPTTFFYEDDWREIAEGDPLQGALIQVSLIAESRILQQLELAALPDDLLTAYTDFLVANTYEEVQVGEWVNFAWGDYAARGVGVRYPIEYSAHASGTRQQLILVAVEGGLMMLTIYAPSDEWEAAQANWQTVLSSSVLDGEVLPIAPLLEANIQGE